MNETDAYLGNVPTHRMKNLTISIHQYFLGPYSAVVVLRFNAVSRDTTSTIWTLPKLELCLFSGNFSDKGPIMMGF